MVYKKPNIHLIELNAIQKLIPFDKFGVKIGVGTGRFASPPGIKVGVNPSRKIIEISRKKGIKVYEAVAEQLSFDDKTFDFVLFVTTVCFVDDLVKSFKEAHRVLKTDGFINVGFVDKESELGKRYHLKREKSKFYKDANFYSIKEFIDFLRKTSFEVMIIKQTVFPSSTVRLDSIEDGYGEVSFVIIKANKNN